MILSTKCDVNLHDFEKATALHLAAEEGATECVRALLNAGAVIDERRRNECTPVMLAAQRGIQPIIIAFRINTVAIYIKDFEA